MKRILLIIVTVFLLALSCAGLMACGGDHTHTFEEKWSYGEGKHWHKATCGHDKVVSNKESHILGDDDVCDVCGYDVEPDSTGLKLNLSSNEEYYQVGGMGSCEDENVVIPATNFGMAVARIEGEAFANKSLIKSISIPNCIEAVGKDAFKDCENLVFNEYNDGLYLGNKSNPYLVFVKPKSRETTNISINSMTKVICDSAFSSTLVEEVIIPDSVTNIGIESLGHCSSLKSVSIGSGVKSVDEKLFAYCNELKTITISEQNSVFYSEGNCIINKETKELVLACNGTVIPSGVKKIGSSAFSQCFVLKEVIIPEGVVEICKFAFYDCLALNKVIIAKSVESIGQGAFANCSNIQSVIIPEGITSLSSQVFGGCTGLKKIVLPTSVTYIGMDAFYYCTNLYIYYAGSSGLWKSVRYDVRNAGLNSATKVFYSETKPTSNLSSYWRYVSGEPKIWS